MIYRSNLTAPDLQPFFRHTVCREIPSSRGHDVLSDFSDKPDGDPVFGVYKQAGFMTHDEAAILYTVALEVGGEWLDIGGLTGWTAAHLAAAGCPVISVDPMYAVPDFQQRALSNLVSAGFYHHNPNLFKGTSKRFFEESTYHFNGILIDGDHVAPAPLKDAICAAARVRPDGVIVFHDGVQPSVQEAYLYLSQHGWKTKIYHTPYVVVVCYHDPFVPPEHVPDPNLVGGRV